MAEILEKLEQCLDIEQLQQTIMQLDDHHRPRLGESVWLFTHHNQPYEFIRHGGFLSAGQPE
jgi:hypothetical protein